jgi:DNA-directed RNA polymerase subunit RPC12/RpoP
MKGDEYLCKRCKKKWKADRKGLYFFCERCYGRDVVNLSREERIKKRKAETEEKNRKMNELAKLMAKKRRMEVARNWEKKNRYFRGRGGKG